MRTETQSPYRPRCTLRSTHPAPRISANKASPAPHHLEPPVSHIQELAVCLLAGIEFAFGLLASQAAVVPGHPLMGCGGNELLHLGGLADDGLF